MGARELEYRHLALSVTYKTVFFPFDNVRFIKALPQQGFVLPESLEQAALPGPRARISGTVGRKGDLSVQMSDEQVALSVFAPDIKSAIEEMDALEALIAKSCNLEESAQISHYEFQVSLTVAAKTTPTGSWQRHSDKTEFAGSLSDAVGMPLSLYGIRVASKESLPIDNNWFDFRIEPLVNSPNKVHWVQVVVRRPSREDLFAFLGNFENIIEKFLSVVEV